jgi:hypothetical protein
MFNVCYHCGSYNVVKDIKKPETGANTKIAYAVCPDCGHLHPFKYFPLFVVCGASGTGKTRVCRELVADETPFIPLDGDILWHPVFDQPGNHYHDFYEVWLRLAKNIGQAGKPVIFFNGGAGVPGNLERCMESRYFSSFHKLALICEKTILTQRLEQRPGWRNCDRAFITSQHDFNQWYRIIGPTLDPPITTLDTSNKPITQIVESVKTWLNSFLTTLS